MNEAVLTTIALTGFGVAFFHAAIPTHWLPFVLTARAQRWSHGRTLAITALAGSGHVLFTALLGLFIAWFGIVLNEKIGDWFPRIAGGALLLLGLFYVFRQIITKGHPHTHLFGGHPHAHDPPSQGYGVTGPPSQGYGVTGPPSQGYGVTGPPSQGYGATGPPSQRYGVTGPPSRSDAVPGENKHHQEHEHEGRRAQVSDRTAVLSLLALLTFSPCEAFLPIYASGVRYGWSGFALLTVILSIGCVAGMVIFTAFTLAGVRRIKLGLLEKYESGLMGALLCVIGVLIILFEK
jgi:nickel/cobalt transporter (NicO) family protein